MNDKINTIILDYLNSKQTDYAIMINGKWGCGKTYYVENELKKICEGKKLKYIYVSLNGCDDFNKINRKITYRLILKKDTLNIDDDLLDNIIDIGAGLSKMHTITETASNVIGKLANVVGKPIKNKLLSSIEPSKTTIIFDDLERTSNDEFRNDIIGLIYENYTKKGYKTIFIGDETNINDNKYPLIKEKVIRRTLSYEPDRKTQLSSFICTDNHGDKTKIYLEKNKKLFIDYFIDLDITNLRTVSFVIDNFIHAFENISEDMQNKYGIFVFKNILILTNEYKSGKITDINVIDKNEFINLSNIYYTNKALRERGSQIEKTYLDDFYEKYVTNPSFSDFKLIGTIFDFILTGYFDSSKFDNEIKVLFHDDFIEESEKTYRLLYRSWEDLEEDQLKAEVNKLLTYLVEGKYHIVDLPRLYTFLKLVQENHFLPDWNCNIEKVITDSLSVVSQKPDMIPDLDVINRLNSGNVGLNDQFYNNLIAQIKELSKRKTTSKEVNKIKNIFDVIISHNESCYDSIRNNHSLFHDIVEARYEDHFFRLTNKGINIFQTYIYVMILRISNAGDVSYGEKGALVTIANHLEQNIDDPSKNLNNYRKIRLRQLIADMKKAIDHLENTRKK